MRLGLLCVSVIVTATMGCATQRSAKAGPPPSVGTSQIDHFQPPPSGSTRVGTPSPIIIPPGPLHQILPKYPESALSEAVACVARILYHVEISGQATLVRLEWDDPPPAEYVTEFEEAIRTAISQWSFIPAVRIVSKTQDDGSIVRTPVPKAQHALIRFRVEDGKAIVE